MNEVTFDRAEHPGNKEKTGNKSPIEIYGKVSRDKDNINAGGRVFNKFKPVTKILRH